MPVYEFICHGECNKLIEVKIPMEQEKPTVCPACGGELSRVWGAVPAHYHAEGFTLRKGRNEAGEPIVDRKH